MAAVAARTLAQDRGQRPVLLDHDGGMPDDYLVVMLLLTMQNVRTLGIVVTPADCYPQPAVSATRKILDLMHRSDLTVAESTVRALHPFPDAWRKTSFIMDHFPMLNEASEIRTPLARETGQAYMARLLRESSEPVTLLVTGPLSTVAAVLDKEPQIESKIREIVWMGGALEAKGNVVEPDHDGSAEWNVYWDPPAAARVWGTRIPIVLCPLDITNTVPVTTAFLQRLARLRRYPLCDLAGQSLAVAYSPDFYFWDLLTAAYVGRPDLFTVKERETVIVTEGDSQGRTKLQVGGRKVRVMENVNPTDFHDYVLKQWSK